MVWALDTHPAGRASAPPRCWQTEGKAGEGEMHSPFARPGTIREHDPLKWAALQKMKSFIKSVRAGKLAIQVEKENDEAGKMEGPYKRPDKSPLYLTKLQNKHYKTHPKWSKWGWFTQRTKRKKGRLRRKPSKWFSLPFRPSLTHLETTIYTNSWDRGLEPVGPSGKI